MRVGQDDLDEIGHRSSSTEEEEHQDDDQDQEDHSATDVHTYLL
jgi:hypothetical protein